MILLIHAVTGVASFIYDRHLLKLLNIHVNADEFTNGLEHIKCVGQSAGNCFLVFEIFPKRKIYRFSVFYSYRFDRENDLCKYISQQSSFLRFSKLDHVLYKFVDAFWLIQKKKQQQQKIPNGSQRNRRVRFNWVENMFKSKLKTFNRFLFNMIGHSIFVFLFVLHANKYGTFNRAVNGMKSLFYRSMWKSRHYMKFNFN